MSKDVTILVGDRFEEFAKNPFVRLISAFMASVRAGEVGNHPIILGQGLSHQAIEELEALRPEPLAAAGRSRRADRKLTHKHAPKNIMISEPRQIGDARFEADLQLDDRNEVMEDHQTGQHIQGLALIEAARQLWTAVTERFLLTGSKSTRFVIDRVNASFEHFVFPLPSTLSLEVLGVQETPPQQQYDVRIAVHQVSRQAATIEARYRVIDERLSARQEMIAARRAVETVVAAGGR